MGMQDLCKRVSRFGYAFAYPKIKWVSRRKVPALFSTAFDEWLNLCSQVHNAYLLHNYECTALCQRVCFVFI